MKILVTGATGSQAKPVVFQLLEKGHEVVAFTRDKSNAKDLVDAGASIYEGDLTVKEDVKTAMKDIDAVAMHISFFMPNPSTAAQNLLGAAKDAKVDYIVWNTAGMIFPEKTGNPAYDVRSEVQQQLDQ